MKRACESWRAYLQSDVRELPFLKEMIPNVIIPYLEENHPQLEIEFDIVTVLTCSLKSLEELEGGKVLMNHWRLRTQGYFLLKYLQIMFNIFDTTVCSRIWDERTLELMQNEGICLFTKIDKKNIGDPNFDFSLSYPIGPLFESIPGN